MNVVESRRFIRKRRKRTGTSDRDTILLKGGLNLIDSPVAMDPGNAITGTKNFEVMPRGYRVVPGYERYIDVEVPGEGAILGIHASQHRDVYATRKRVGSDDCGVFEAIGGPAWSEIPPGDMLDMDALESIALDPTNAGYLGNNSETSVDIEIEGNTSGATANVARAFFTDGNLEAQLGLINLSGTFVNDEDIVISGTATVLGKARQGNYTADRPEPAQGNERFQWVSGVSGTSRVFFIDNETFNLFEIASTIGGATSRVYYTYNLQDAGIGNSAPRALSVFSDHLFISGYGNYSHSGFREPTSFLADDGANSYTTRFEPIEGFAELTNAFFVFGSTFIEQIVGNTVDDFQIFTHDDEKGAVHGTVQSSGIGFYVNRSGFYSVAPTDAYGDYSSSNLSAIIDPLIKDYFQEEAFSPVTGSVVTPDKKHYRLFFEDGSAISMCFDGGRVLGFMPLEYPDPISCAAVGSTALYDLERLLFGMDDDTGFVYIEDIDASFPSGFDGGDIEAVLNLAYHHSGSPDRVKTYRSARIEMNKPLASTQFNPDTVRAKARLDFGEKETEFTPNLDIASAGHAVKQLKSFRIGRDAQNISLQVEITGQLVNATLTSVIYQTAMRGRLVRETEAGV